MVSLSRDTPSRATMPSRGQGRNRIFLRGKFCTRSSFLSLFFFFYFCSPPPPRYDVSYRIASFETLLLENLFYGNITTVVCSLSGPSRFLAIISRKATATLSGGGSGGGLEKWRKGALSESEWPVGLIRTRKAGRPCMHAHRRERRGESRARKSVTTL